MFLEHSARSIYDSPHHTKCPQMLPFFIVKDRIGGRGGGNITNDETILEAYETKKVSLLLSIWFLDQVC